MSQKPTTYRSMTAVDNARYVQMVSRLHDLGSFATHHFMAGEIDRAKLSTAVVALLESAINGLIADYQIVCAPGECPCHGLCIDCGPPIFDERAFELTQEKLGQLIDEIGVTEVEKMLSEKLGNS